MHIDLWHLAEFLAQSLLGAAGVGVAFLGVASTKLGEKVLNHFFDRRLAALKHGQDQKIEGLRASLSRLGDRGVRSNEREYNAIITAWESFIDAQKATQQ